MQMKTLLIVPMFAALIGCGDSAPTTNFVKLDLTPAELKATIMAPKGSTAENPFGTVKVKSGDGSAFHLDISYNFIEPLSKVHDYFKKNDVQKLKKVHSNTTELFIAETEAFGTTSFFMSSIVADGKIRCDSNRGAPVYTLAHVKAMAESCKTITLTGPIE